jgi:hypothetical protein
MDNKNLKIQELNYKAKEFEIREKQSVFFAP